MIGLDGVSREWPKFAIRDITLDVLPGEYLVIMGPTGAGKTLLLELILGIHRPGQGRILLDGVDVTRLPPEKRGIGMVYQDPLLFPNLDVSGNMAFGLRYRKKSAESEDLVHETAKLLGIEQLLHRYPDTLSGGEKQRAAIGRALVTGPRVLLLDEPFSALDPRTRRRLRMEIRQLHQTRGLTLVHVTHDLSEARSAGGRIALIDQGRLKALASAQDMLRRPETVFAASFFGCLNLFEARRVEGAATVRSGPLVAHAREHRGTRFHIVVHPDEIMLAPVSARPGTNVLRGTVKGLTDEGNFVSVAIEVEGLADVLTAYTNRHTVQALGLVPGAPIGADVGEDLHVISECD